MQKKIAILGAGNIGIAIANGITDAKITNRKVTITRVSSPFLADEKVKYDCLTDNQKAVQKSNIVILAVQPKQLDALAAEIKGVITQKHLIISVISGASISRIKELLEKDKLAVVRAMPNVAIRVGHSMTCLAFDGVSPEHKKTVESIFKSVGEVLEIPEQKFAEATVLVGSGPAIVFKFIRFYMQAAINAGFREEAALLLANNVVHGASQLLIETGTHPEVLIDTVTTPGGCTIGALLELEHKGFGSALLSAIFAGIKRSNELYAKK